MASKFASLLRESWRASTDPIYAERLSTSWILPPLVLFALRVFLSAYAFIVIFFVLGWDSTHSESEAAEHSFSYFTDLTYWGLAFYFAFAAAHTGSYALTGRPWLAKWPTILRWLHSAYYATVTVYPFIVTAVFWAILSDGAYASRFSSFSNISMHALNSVFAGFEILIPRSDPHPWLLLIPLIVILALYLGLAYLTHATEGFYVYSFLDIQENGSGLVAGACIGILVGAIIVFVLVRYLIWIRRWVNETKLGMTGKFSSRHRPSGSNGLRDEVHEISVVEKQEMTAS